MSRRKSLKSLGDWIGAGGHSFDGSLMASDIRQLDLDQLVPSRYQPRQRMDDAYLAELEQSIRQFGVIEPLVARSLANGGYEILAGHMRWQAAQRAGLRQAPVVVREADDRTAAAIALVENLLRRDLNPIEEGRALRRLREEFGLTQEQLAELLGAQTGAATDVRRRRTVAGRPRPRSARTGSGRVPCPRWPASGWPRPRPPGRRPGRPDRSRAAPARHASRHPRWRPPARRG